MEEEALPEEMKKMSPKERKAYVDKNLKKRAKIQAKIQKLNPVPCATWNIGYILARRHG